MPANAIPRPRYAAFYTVKPWIEHLLPGSIQGMDEDCMIQATQRIAQWRWLGDLGVNGHQWNKWAESSREKSAQVNAKKHSANRIIGARHCNSCCCSTRLQWRLPIDKNGAAEKVHPMWKQLALGRRINSQAWVAHAEDYDPREWIPSMPVCQKSLRKWGKQWTSSLTVYGNLTLECEWGRAEPFRHLGRNKGQPPVMCCQM